MIANTNFAATCRPNRAISRLAVFLELFHAPLFLGLVMLGAMTLGATNLRATAQDPSGPPPPKNETVEKSGKKPAPATSTKDDGAKPDPYDPLHAAKDVEVGTYYMHKGDISAAIDRFKHAITLREDFAKPRLLLGECYEKKDDPENAIRYYQEYLKVLPRAPDAKKVRERIAKLTQEQRSPR